MWKEEVEMVHKKTKANAGETLVEVMASIFIFLIMMGILQSAVSYSHAALLKNKEIRANNAAALSHLAETSPEDVSTESVSVSFVAATSDLQQFGSQVFTVKTKLQKKTVSYTDTDGQPQTITVYVYGGDGL